MLEVAKVALGIRPGLVAVLVLLGLLVAAVEGVGISLLLPIVEGINTREFDEASHPVSRFFFDVLTAFGIPFTTTVLALLGLTMFGAQAVLVLLRTMTIVRIRVAVETTMRTSLFERLFAARVGYFDDQQIGRLSNAVILECARTGSATLNLLNAAVLALLVSGYVVVAIIVSWRLAILGGVMLLIVAALTRRSSGIRARGRRITSANRGLESTAVEYLSAMREVNALGLQSHARSLFDRAASDVASQNFKTERVVAGYRLLLEMAAVLITACLLAVGGLVLGVEAAAVVAFFVLLLRLAPNAIQVQNLLHKFHASQPGFEEVHSIMADAHVNAALAVGAGAPVGFVDGLVFENVTFTYDGRVNALEGVSFTIDKGTFVGVVGASGAGKSTLVDLLLRFADPTSGAIRVGGTALEQIDPAAWRAGIGFVAQESFLFHESIYRNIALGNPKTDGEQVLAAAKRAGVHEFAQQQPEGYETVVGDRGGMLSGGQRQRIALARALVRDPAILLLDEATSDLDSQSQAAIHRSLRSMHGERTMIVVAHRLATVRDADKILVFDRGQLVEQGTHDDLLALDRYYADLYRTEFGSQDDHR